MPINFVKIKKGINFFSHYDDFRKVKILLWVLDSICHDIVHDRVGL